jgi:hypothetical protein
MVKAKNKNFLAFLSRQKFLKNLSRANINKLT